VKQNVNATPAAIYRFVYDYWTKNGRGPTYAEVSHGMGYASRQGCYHPIKAMITQGMLEVLPGRHRTLRPAGVPIRELMLGDAA